MFTGVQVAGWWGGDAWGRPHTQALAVENEIKARVGVAGSVWHGVEYYVVPDPSNARVGSGGATFNALITVEDLMSSRTDVDILNSRVFVIHSGGDSQRLPVQSVCGKAWSSFPVVHPASQNLEAPIDMLLATLFRLFETVRAGVVVASSDVLLDLDDTLPPGAPCTTVFEWPAEGATGLAFPADKSYGPNHGTYTVDGASVGGTHASSGATAQ